MGYRLAEAARDRGARGDAGVRSDRARALRAGIELVARALGRGDGARGGASTAPRATVVAMAAAVSDYRPASVSDAKVKKSRRRRSAWSWCAPPTSCAGWAQAKGGRFLVGFAAETDQLLENARKKLRDKNVDLLVANDVGRDGSGFAADTNAAVLIDARRRGRGAAHQQAGAGRADLGPRGRAARCASARRGGARRDCGRARTSCSQTLRSGRAISRRSRTSGFPRHGRARNRRPW